MHQLAIDPGHGYIKGLSAHKRILIPALIHSVSSTVSIGGLGRTGVTRIDGRPYLVGKAAQRLATPLWSRDKSVDDDTLRLILVAAAELGASGPVQLATDLPLSWYRNQQRSFKKALRGYGGTVVRPDGKEVRLWFETVLVFPQGAAAAGPVLAHESFEPGPYLVVDPGERTTEFLVVIKETDGHLTFDTVSAGSLEIGMHSVHTAVAETLSQQYQTKFTPAQVAAEDFVVVRGEKIDITEERQRQETHMVRAISKGLAERLDDEMDKVLGMIAVGGGGGAIARLIPGAVKPDDAEWANAQGCLAALEEWPAQPGSIPGVV